MIFELTGPDSVQCTKLSQLNLLLTTAWIKYQNGLADDACTIAGKLLQHPLLSEEQTPIENRVLLAEVRLLTMFCRLSKGSYVESASSKPKLHSLPQFQGRGAEIIEKGPLQIGRDVVKLTCTLLGYFSSPSCSQDLSRIALTMRTHTISFTARRMMAKINGWIGLAADMSLFCKLTSESAREFAFSIR